MKGNINHGLLIEYVNFQFENVALLRPILPPQIFFSLGLFHNMFHNLITKTNNYCIGYMAPYCFFENIPEGMGEAESGWKNHSNVKD